jgi:anti-anti-sigma regulatory factor
VEPNSESIAIILEGRVAGPWAAELGRTWAKLAPTVGKRKLAIDLTNTTYADDAGIGVLREIYSSTAADLVTSSPWTQYLADEVSRTTTAIDIPDTDTQEEL